jgi:geranylgeranyl diphosphate synthase, type II
LNTATLEQYLSVRRQEIEQALDHYLPKPPDCPSLVYEAMRYSLMAGGKRLRPVLALASAEAIAANHRASIDTARTLALPAACAIEMIHTYSLIHDDLPAMDDDVLRRGRPTLHVVYGEGLAILAGDGLHAEAFALLAREPKSDAAVITARKLRVTELIATAAGTFGMVGGQAIDLEAVARVPGRGPAPPLDERALETMHARKTGAILRAAAVAGATMAGADDAELSAIDRYASEVGLAFQIVDDILDVEGASEALGKTAGKDAAAGKPTYPSLFGLERSRQLANVCLTRAHAALRSAALGASRLAEIADWVVQRHS